MRPIISPHTVKKMIGEALVRGAQTDGERITVEAQRGKVILEADSAGRGWSGVFDMAGPGIIEVSNQSEARKQGKENDDG